METIFFFLFCIIVIILGIRDNKQKSRTRHPYRESYSRNTDQKYLERIFILDAAEHGLFLPGAERVFEDDYEEDESDWDELESSDRDDDSNYWDTGRESFYDINTSDDEEFYT